MAIDSGDKYLISYELNGSTMENFSEGTRTYSQISLSLHLDNPTKEGYTFIGWTGSNGDTPQLNVTILEGTIGDLSYTANWQEN